MGTAIKHPVPERVKPSPVIFDIRALWRSALSVIVPGCQNDGIDGLTRSGTRRMLYSCTRPYGNSGRQRVNNVWCRKLLDSQVGLTADERERLRRGHEQKSCMMSSDWSSSWSALGQLTLLRTHVDKVARKRALRLETVEKEHQQKLQVMFIYFSSFRFSYHSLLF